MRTALAQGSSRMVRFSYECRTGPDSVETIVPVGGFVRLRGKKSSRSISSIHFHDAHCGRQLCFILALFGDYRRLVELRHTTCGTLCCGPLCDSGQELVFTENQT